MTKWTEDEIAKVIGLYGMKHTLGEIAERFPGRTRCAVAGIVRRWREKQKGRPKPPREQTKPITGATREWSEEDIEVLTGLRDSYNQSGQWPWYHIAKYFNTSEIDCIRTYNEAVGDGKSSGARRNATGATR